MSYLHPLTPFSANDIQTFHPFQQLLFYYPILLSLYNITYSERDRNETIYSDLF